MAPLPTCASITQTSKGSMNVGMLSKNKEGFVGGVFLFLIILEP